MIWWWALNTGRKRSKFLESFRERLAKFGLELKAELRYRRHQPIPSVGDWLHKVIFRLLPIPCGSGEHRSAPCLWATCPSVVASDSWSPQSERNVALGSTDTDLRPLDSSTSCRASISDRTVPRHSSKVGAVCVDAHVRICAGGDQQGSSLPQRSGCIHRNSNAGSRKLG